jgi:hypothetical protein
VAETNTQLHSVKYIRKYIGGKILYTISSKTTEYNKHIIKTDYHNNSFNSMCIYIL